MKKRKPLLAFIMSAVVCFSMFQSAYALAEPESNKDVPQNLAAFDSKQVKQKLQELFPSARNFSMNDDSGQVIVPLNVNEPLVLNFDDGSSITYEVKVNATNTTNASIQSLNLEVNKIYKYGVTNYADISIIAKNVDYDGNRKIYPSSKASDTYQWINKTLFATVDIGDTTAKGVVSGGSVILEAKATGKINWEVPVIGGTSQVSYSFGMGVDPLLGVYNPYLIEY